MKKIYYIITAAKAKAAAKSLLKKHNDFIKKYSKFAKSKGSTISDIMYSRGHVFGSGMNAFRVSGITFKKLPSGWRKASECEHGVIAFPKRSTKAGKSLSIKVSDLLRSIPSSEDLWSTIPVEYRELLDGGSMHFTVAGMIGGKIVVLTCLHDNDDVKEYAGAKRIESWKYEKMVHDANSK